MEFHDILMAVAVPIAVSTGTGAIAWLFKLAPRIAVTETKQDTVMALIAAQKELINQRFDDMDESLDRRLGRIERAMNGAWKNAGS